MKKVRSTVAALAALACSIVAAQTYSVHELPARRFVKGAFIYNATSTAALDFRGRSLIYAMAFFEDGRQLYRGEHCNAEGSRCSLLEPKDVDNGWNTLSQNGRYRAGVVLTAPGTAGSALRQKLGSDVEYLFCCGESRAVNNAGTVVGVSDNASRAWLFDTQRHNLPGLQGGYAQAAGISNLGLVVGEGRNNYSERRAIAWPSASGDLYLLQTGVPDGLHFENYAVAVTGAGVAYGGSNYLEGHPSPLHAVRFEGGEAVDLGAISPARENSSGALAVNNDGVAVGWSSNGSGPQEAALFDGTGNVLRLSALIPEADRAKYEQLIFATAINDSGQILVTAYRKTTYELVVLRLDPVNMRD